MSYLKKYINGRNSYSAGKFNPMLAGFGITILVLGVGTASELGSVNDPDATWSFLTFLAGTVVIYYGLNGFLELRTISNTPSSKIRSLAKGRVEVKGRATALNNQILRSPLSQEKCLAYRYEVYEKQRQTPLSTRKRWKKIDEGRKDQYFELEDGTGKVFINSQNAELDVKNPREFNAGGFQGEPPEEVKNFVKRNEQVDENDGLIFDSARRYKEWYLPVNEDIYVFGYADTETSRSGRYEVIKYDESLPFFKISDKSEHELVEHNRWMAYKALPAGIIINLIGYIWLLADHGAI